MPKKQTAKEIKVKNFPKTFPVEIKEKHFWKDLKFLIPVGISIISLLFSLNVFSFFSPQTHFAGVYITTAYEPTNTITLIAPFEFLNSGGKNGVVEDIYFTVTKNEKTFTYSPFYEVDLLKLSQERPAKPHEYWTKQFQPFPIPGNSNISKTIFFADLNKPLILEKGEYVLELYIKTSKDSKAKKVEKFNLKITNNDLETYNRGKFMFFRKDGLKEALRFLN